MRKNKPKSSKCFTKYRNTMNVTNETKCSKLAEIMQILCK